MDQVKAQLAVVMKYGFWISSVIVLIGSVVIWYLTTSKLSDEYDSQSGKIKNAVQQVVSTQGELPSQPNDHSHEIMEEMIDARRDEVLESWETLFERQQEILKWPTDVFTSELIDEYKDNIPIETFVNHPTEDKDELETSLRNQYATYIKEVLPDLAAIAGTEWTASFEATGMSMEMGMGMGGNPGGGMSMLGGNQADVDITGSAKGPLVIWEGGSQSAVLKDMFPWRGSTPTTLEIYYSQENLWILRQLMQIVAEVNGDVSQSYQAKIREIKQIGIGESVKFDAGNISTPGSGASGMMGGMMGGMGEMMDMGMGMEMGDMDPGGTTGPAPDPADNRYLNALREPITGQTLRSALTSNSPNDAALAVAKRVPVKMTFVMDQRAVPELIAVCGSAPLMVEVSQVRVLPKDAASGTGGMMGGDLEMEGGLGEMDEGPMGGGMMGGMMGGMGGPGGPMGGGGLADTPVEEFPLDLYVEVYGIIYIYNPPDGEKLGVEQVTEDTVVEGLPEATVTPPVTTDADTTTPAGDTTTPAGDTTTPAGDTTTPAGDTTTPAGDTTTPAG
ncbi:MAG: hypothetical protein P1U77_02105, partial [Rubripirellula sp.]|nr:hypothetical protein [Rubripirellula sp.]